MANKQSVRPIYSELQGCLAQAPQSEKAYDTMDDKDAWNHYHSTIDELNEIT